MQIFMFSLAAQSIAAMLTAGFHSEQDKEVRKKLRDQQQTFSVVSL